MRFSEITERLTGISCPIFGVSWNPPESERTKAIRIIRYLEDRRVLYVPSEMELPSHCVHSVMQMREYLTKELQSIAEDVQLFHYVKAMRISCRKFVDRMNFDDPDSIRRCGHWGDCLSWVFASALGEMRGTFGIMVAQVAATYGIDVEDDLAKIIPEKND